MRGRVQEMEEMRRAALKSLQENSDVVPPQAKRSDKTREVVLDLVMNQGLAPAAAARKAGVSRQRAHTIVKGELTRLQDVSTRGDVDGVKVYYLSVVMQARKEVGELPAAEIAPAGIYYGKVVAKNIAYYAILDEEYRCIRVVLSASSIRIPRLGSRIRVKMQAGMAAVDAAP